MTKPIEEHNDQQLRNVIENHRKQGKLREPYYLAAIEELTRRKGHGLEVRKSVRSIHTAASEGRFLSYKELAETSGADWSKVRYLVNTHLGDLIEYAYGKGWPMLSAIVVNQQNVATGEMKPETLKGFVDAARWLGYPVTDEKAFLLDQQKQVRDWASEPLVEE